jgi:hypothetical protein
MGASEWPKADVESEPNEDEGGQVLGQPPNRAHETPLFLRGGSDGRKGDAQDEKDEVGE